MSGQKDARRSMWGEGHAEAVRKANTTRNLAMPGLRPQEILTPPCILDPIRELWGEIALDPCGSKRHEIAEVTRFIDDENHGLASPWVDRTFINPPFGKLKDWLAHSREIRGHERLAIFCPVRTHRAWFRETAQAMATVFYLRPIKFVGYAQAFPAPLCLMFTANTPEEVRGIFPEDFGGVL